MFQDSTVHIKAKLMEHVAHTYLPVSYLKATVDGVLKVEERGSV